MKTLFFLTHSSFDDLFSVSKWRCKLLSLGFFLTTLFPFNIGYAQPGNLNFQHIGSKYRLQDSNAEFIYRDSRDLVWISSIAGLQKFDGTELVVYNDSTGLRDNFIQSDFYEDVHSNIWFATYTAIHQYNRADDDFSSFQVVLNEQDTIEADYHVFFLEVDTFLWLVAGNSIVKRNIFTGEQKVIGSTNGKRFAVDTLENGRVIRLIEMPWIVSPGFTLSCLEKDSIVCRETFFADQNPLTFRHAYFDPQDLVWLSTDQGLMKFNLQFPGEYQLFSLPAGLDDYISKCVPFDDRFLIVGAKSSGVFWFDLQKEEFVTQIPSIKESVWGIKSKKIYGVYIDDQREVWISQENETNIDHAWLDQNQFMNPLEHIGDVPDRVRSIIEDQSANIWLNFGINGLFKMDLEGQIIQRFSEMKLKRIFKAFGDQIYGIGTKDLYQFDSAKSQWQKVFSFPLEYSPNFSVSLTDDKQLFSTSLGLVVLHSFEYGYVLEPLSYLTYLGWDYFQLFKTSDGKIFAPQTDGSYQFFTWEADSLRLLENIQGKDQIFDFYEEPESGKIWLGSSGGLLYLNAGRNPVQVKDLFFDPSLINGVSSDHNGKLWLTSNNGLWKYDPETGQTQYYNTEDGLPEDEFFYTSNLTASDGKIWLGTSEGLVVFHPDSIQPHPFIPPFHFKSFKVNNVEYLKDGKDVNELNKIALPYNKNDLYLKIGAISYFLSERNKICYVLENYQDQWQIQNNQAEITFNNLPPGNYLLRVYAVNANGLKTPENQLNIVIKPPVWQQAWFWVLVIIFTGAIVYGAVRSYVRRQLRQKQIVIDRQKALEKERNRIAGELHDDLGSGLSTIRILSEPILYDNLDKEQSEILGRIHQSSQHLLDNMSEIIWAMNSENDRLGKLAEAIRNYAYRFTEDHNLDCKVVLPDNMPDLELSGRQRRNIFLAVKEAMYNVVKHARASKITVKIELLSEKEIQLKVMDNGIGLQHKENNGLGGNGIKNIKKRIESLGGEVHFLSNEGTSVIVKIPAG